MEKVGANCPINGKQVNEIVVRMIAMQVVFLVFTAWWFQNPLISGLLVLDFGLRAFGFSRYSPLRFLAQKTVLHFQLGYKAADEAPKKFAAAIGFFVAILLTALLQLHFAVSASLIGGILLLFASLEAGFGICVGCILYRQLGRFHIIG